MVKRPCLSALLSSVSQESRNWFASYCICALLNSPNYYLKGIVVYSHSLLNDDIAGRHLRAACVFA